MRSAIIGLGGWGQRLARSVHGKSDLIEISRGVTRTVEKAAEFSRSTGIPIGGEYDAVLADPAIEAVILATPHSQHVEQVVKAARAGKHVFVEKPLALSCEGVCEAFEACAEANVVLAVGQNRRFLPSVAHIRQMIDAGELGQVLHIEGNYSGPSGWRHAQSNWRASDAESPWGGMTGKGLHVSDLMIHFAGPIAEVDARSARQVIPALDDTTIMLLRFAGGAYGYLGTLTATADVWRLQVFGSKAWVEMRDLETLVIAVNGEAPRTLRFDPVDIEKAELEAFASAVRLNREFPVSRADVENNIGLLEAVGASVRSGAPAQIRRGEAKSVSAR